MTEPEVSVTITDTEFSFRILQAFLARIQSIDGMPADPMISVTSDGSKNPFWSLTASTAFRPHHTEGPFG